MKTLRRDLAALLHLLEQMGERAADFQFLRAAFEDDELAAAYITGNADDGLDVDAGGAVDLPELFGIEFRDEFLDRFFDQGLVVFRQYPRVFGVRLEIQDLFDRHKAQVIAYRHLQPLQVCRFRAWYRCAELLSLKKLILVL